MNKSNSYQDLEELKSLLQYRHEITSLRVNLLTFSFTTVLAVIGIAFANLDKDIPSFLYLLPYFLIIPFTARITYYRINSAHRGSFLRVFYPDFTKFERGTMFVREQQRKSFKLIAFLVNMEMLFLGIACSILFLYFEYEEYCSIKRLSIVFSLIWPLIVGVIIFQRLMKCHHS